MAAVVIELMPDGAKACVFSPFEAKDVIKALPYSHRAWDQGNRCWLVSASMVQRLTALLEAEKFTVRVIEAEGPAPAPSRAIGGWADQMYSALGLSLADTAHKALSRVLHPDAGGNAEEMKRLNAARDRAHGRNHRH